MLSMSWEAAVVSGCFGYELMNSLTKRTEPYQKACN